MKRLIILAALAPLLLFAAPAQAAYNHLATCEGTLRGIASDDDIHALGVATNATGFGGWGTYWHDVNGAVYVYGLFNYPGGIQRWYLGHCWAGDYGPDTIG
jgi:hypothetical protein